MVGNPEAASAESSGAFESIAKLFNQFGGLVGSIAGFATAVGLVWKSESEALRWSVIGLTGIVLLFAVSAQVIYPWLVKRREQRVIGIKETETTTPTTFRLRPYEEPDHDAFDRPDNAHQQALTWLDEADPICLYITGFSGTGKSSLLQAWLIPELALAKDPVTTLVVRSFADPIAQLTEALKKKNALPFDLPEGETDPRKLLERAADGLSAQHGRLLIAIDQFEESMILQDDETKARLKALFQDLRDNPIENLQLLFVLRTDYLKFDELTALGLPDPRPRENWFNLEALSHADARKILRHALPDLKQDLEDQVVNEASEVDDLPGLIRPITLNMMGLVLQRFAGSALTQTAPGRLIQDYLRQCMAKPGIEQVSPKLLAQMITDKGTKKPIAEADLANAGTDPALARKTLYLLGEEGVVRELDRDQKIWEISHDFVARQLGQIIPRLQPSWWQRAQKAATPVAVIAWLVILGAGYPIYETWHQRYVFSLFQAEGVTIHGEEGAYRIRFEGISQGVFERLFPHVEALNPVELTIRDNSRLQALPSLDGLNALTSLHTRGNGQLQAVAADVEACTKLNDVQIWGNNKIVDLPKLGEFDRLEVIAFDAADVEASIEALKGMPATTLIKATRDYLDQGYADRLNEARRKEGRDPIRVESF